MAPKTRWLDLSFSSLFRFCSPGGVLGGPLAHFGILLVPFGSLLAPSGLHVGRFWCISRAPFGSLWAPSRLHVGRFWRISRSRTHLVPCLRFACDHMAFPRSLSFCALFVDVCLPSILASCLHPSAIPVHDFPWAQPQPTKTVICRSCFCSGVWEVPCLIWPPFLSPSWSLLAPFGFHFR